MYNRIGLQTPRGSGTSGYIQSNRAYTNQNKSKLEFLKEMRHIKQLKAPEIKQPSKEVIDYKKKREIYIILEQIRQDKLDQGIDEQLIDDELQKLEEEMLEKYRKKELNINLHNRTNKKFIDSLEKQEDVQKFKKALKIDKDYKTGEAFDQELQQHKKLENLIQKEEQRLKNLECDYKRQKKIKKEKKQKDTQFIQLIFYQTFKSIYLSMPLQQLLYRQTLSFSYFYIGILIFYIFQILVHF